MLAAQQIVGHSELAGGEQISLVAIVLEGSGLADEPVYDMAVVDVVAVTASQSGQIFDLSLGIPDLDVVGVYAGFDPFSKEPTVQRVAVLEDTDRAEASYLAFHFGVIIVPFAR
jgi:hypothetical protein